MAEYNRISYWQVSNRQIESTSVFERAFDQNLSQARREQYARQAREITNNLADWARQHDLWPYSAFLHGGIPMRAVVVPTE
jgi:hypothetical protein